MAKKIIRRVPSDDPPRRRAKKTAAKARPKDYVVIAWVREDGDSAACSCGKMSVELDGTDAILRGQHGWIREGQWITCGVKGTGPGSGCLESIRFSPRLVWETSVGTRYTSNIFLRDGETKRRIDDE